MENLNENSLISQFASSVSDFSTQYGRENGQAYMALNLAGNISMYPRYGDFTQCCVFRTYGPWWDTQPSSMKTSKSRVFGFISKDYIELKYSIPVFIESISIYETYHPGSIVAIYAFDLFYKKWTNIWSIFDSGQFKTNQEAKNRPLPAKTSQNFMPILSKKFVYSDLIRLEIEDSGEDYYVELDGVELFGYETQPNEMLLIDLNNLKISDKDAKILERQESSYLNLINLPIDILNVIVKKLDIISLLRLRSTCKIFYELCSDSFLYREIDLQQFWHSVNTSVTNTLSALIGQTKYLNLSWTKNIDPNSLLNLFIKPAYLTTLKLANCNYVSNQVLETVCFSCSNLEELDLQSCQNLTCFTPIVILKYLKNLNLYRTFIVREDLVEIITSCFAIEFLNLGSCICIDDFNFIINVIATQNRRIKGLNLWRAYTLTNKGMKKLAENCHDLEELDLGWTKMQPFTSIHTLIRNCPKLKTLFMPGVRVSDVELNMIAQYSHEIKQFDVLGSGTVTVEAVENVLKKCKNLEFFDVSFCTRIDFDDYQTLKERYPKCSIKKSYQNV